MGGHLAITRGLVQVETGLLPMNGVEVEAHPGHGDLAGLGLGSEQDSGADFQALRLPARRVIPLNDGLHTEHGANGFGDHPLAEIHPEGLGLESGNTTETIDDDPRQTVALAPEDAANQRVDPEGVAVGLSPLETTPEEILVKILPASGESARNDLGLGIVNGASEHPVTAILDGDDIPVLGIAEDLEDLGPVDPVMAVQDARPRSDDKAPHRVRK